jgi:DNA-binding CsgD family transcriptional regulator
MTPGGVGWRGMDPDTPPRRVSFIVDDDADARTIASVLEALGFEAHRSMESANALHWGIARLVRRYNITPREQAVLELMLTEQLDDEQMARRIKTGVGTVVFLRSQILVKAGVPDREQLLRLALQLPALQSGDVS